MIEKNDLARIAAEVGIPLSAETLSSFDRYAEMLVDWNERINLTAITEPGEICIKHFLDSILLLQKTELAKGARLIDVGTGAGFPAVPCVLVRTDLRITLLDSLNKRIGFLQELTNTLGVDAECLHARAEEAGQKADYREQYDCATARAVAHLRELSEYCLPFVKVGGLFAALKGGDVEQELSEAKPAIRLLGGQVESVENYFLPDGSGRSLVKIRKISQTPTKYPRNAGKMKKQPL